MTVNYKIEVKSIKFESKAGNILFHAGLKNSMWADFIPCSGLLCAQKRHGYEYHCLYVFILRNLEEAETETDTGRDRE